MTRTRWSALTAATVIGLGIAGAHGAAAQDGQMVVIANDGVSQSSNAAGASNVVPVRPVREEAQRDHGSNKAQNDQDRAARQANNADSGGDAAPADGFNAGGDGQGAGDGSGTDAAPMQDYSGAPVDSGTTDAVAASGPSTVVVALPSTGNGLNDGYGVSLGLGALAAMAAAAAIAARRIRVA